MRSHSEFLRFLTCAFAKLGWPEDKKLTADDVDRVKGIAWDLRRQEESEIRQRAQDPKPINVEAALDRSKAISQMPVEAVLALVMNTRSMFIGAFVQRYRIGPYFVHFAFPDVKLAVEADDREYHSTPAQIAKDQRRDWYFAHLGWTVLRFRRKEISASPHACADRIQVVYERLLDQCLVKEPWE